MSFALEIANLKKTYTGSRGTVEALKGVSLNIPTGSFFALLGPNGAGKTTLISIASGLVRKTDGVLKMNGLSIDEFPYQAKQSVGVVPQEFNFGIFEKVIDIVVNQAGFYGIARSVARPKAEHYLKQLGLWEKRDMQARMLSGGMKRRLMIARALIHEPKLLILDEPTAGVDLELRRDMWVFLRELNKSGVTIVLTTHYLEEAEELCNKVAIINKGEIEVEGDMKTLLAQMEAMTIIVDVDKPIAPETMTALTDFAPNLTESQLELTLTPTYTLTRAVQVLATGGIDVVSVKNKTNRLEEFFLRKTSK